MFKLKLRQKLILTSVLLGVIPAAIVAAYIGWVSINSGRTAIKEQAIEKLVALREAKKSEIEAYFETLKDQVVTFSNDKMIIDAMLAFKQAFRDYRDEAGVYDTENLENELRSYYTDQFLAKYKTRNKDVHFDVEKVLNSLDADSIALQHAYISNNPNPLGEKDALMRANDQSEYSALHAKYHPHIRDFLKKFEYYDIFLVDPETGDVVYTVFKELDFTTSLINGPYANTGLGEAFRKANASNDPDFVALTDFAPYTPSYEDPAAFIASPIFENGEKVGILIFQMPIDRINNIMTYDHDWKAQGMGESGETYLVGLDFTMRSLGRFIVEDKEGYLEALKKVGVDDSLVDRIAMKGTTIGLQPVKTPGSEKALVGESGTGTFPDYRGVAVVSAYAPLNIAGLDWAILSEVDEAEAFAPVAALSQKIIWWSLAGLLLMALLSAVVGKLFAKSILDPIYYVVGAVENIAKDIEAGQCDLTRPLDPGSNPIGARLANAINKMIASFADIIRDVTDSSTQVADSSESMTQAARITLDNVNRQRSEAEQVATAMNEMAASVQEVADSAANGAELAKAADAQSMEGAKVVNGTVQEIEALAQNVERAAQVIHELEEDSEAIGSVLDVIQSIAEQTNLLALNAAIEAARAGEQGRGFAVVADEVRSLASRTQESTQEIQTIIERLQNRSKQAVGVMSEGQQQAGVGVEQAQAAGKALKEIAEKVAELDHVSTQIAAAANEQSIVAEEINRSIVHISDVSEDNAEAARKAASASQALSELANQQKAKVAEFKV